MEVEKSIIIYIKNCEFMVEDEIWSNYSKTLWKCWNGIFFFLLSKVCKCEHLNAKMKKDKWNKHKFIFGPIIRLQGEEVHAYYYQPKIAELCLWVWMVLMTAFKPLASFKSKFIVTIYFKTGKVQVFFLKFIAPQIWSVLLIGKVNNK